MNFHIFTYIFYLLLRTHTQRSSLTEVRYSSELVLMVLWAYCTRKSEPSLTINPHSERCCNRVQSLAAQKLCETKNKTKSQVDLSISLSLSLFYLASTLLPNHKNRSICFKHFADETQQRNSVETRQGTDFVSFREFQVTGNWQKLFFFVV